MVEQVIIAIGREFGSGGREIAQKLARKLNLPLYDRNLLEKIAGDHPGTVADLAGYDERRGVENRWNHMTISEEDRLAHMEFNYIRKQAHSGESFVVVGHCAEEILKHHSGLISVFIYADQDFKAERVMLREQLTKQEALSLMKRTDCRRQAYHDRFCEKRWGEAATYDLKVNSSWLGIDGTVGMLERYIRKRMEERQKHFG